MPDEKLLPGRRHRGVSQGGVLTIITPPNKTSCLWILQRIARLTFGSTGHWTAQTVCVLVVCSQNGGTHDCNAASPDGCSTASADRGINGRFAAHPILHREGLRCRRQGVLLPRTRRDGRVHLFRYFWVRDRPPSGNCTGTIRNAPAFAHLPRAFHRHCARHADAARHRHDRLERCEVRSLAGSASYRRAARVVTRAVLDADLRSLFLRRRVHPDARRPSAL